MTNTELQCLTSTEVCRILQISRNTLYKHIKNPSHPLSQARVRHVTPFRFRQRAIMDYVGDRTATE